MLPKRKPSRHIAKKSSVMGDVHLSWSTFSKMCICCEGLKYSREKTYDYSNHEDVGKTERGEAIIVEEREMRDVLVWQSTNLKYSIHRVEY